MEKPRSTVAALHTMPFTRLELAVMSLVDGQLQVLLARRAEAPAAGKWALPGGVLRTDADDSLELAAQRVSRERLNRELPFIRQLCAVGGKTRDPRASWTLSVVYRALVPVEGFKPVAGKRVEALAWRPVEDVIADKALAFDHAALIRQAVDVTRVEVRDLALPFEFLPESFTLGELQMYCEQLLGHPLDKSSFRRRLAYEPRVEPIEGQMKGGAFRPAQLYRRHRGVC